MNSKLNYMAMALTVLASSCALAPYDEPATETYTREFVKQFGLIDKKQTWNLATQVTANINLDGTGADTVRVYTAAPDGKGRYLAAKYPAATKSFVFDCPQDINEVYVKAKTPKGRTVVSRYFDITGRTLNVDGSSTRALTRADGDEECNVTLSIGYKNLGKFQDATQSFTDLHPNQYDWNVRYGDLFTLYGLRNVDRQPDGEKKKISDVIGILGTGGVFHEGDPGSGKCNLLRWDERLNSKEGVKLTLAEEGPVTVDYRYGGTDYNNCFGYIYYNKDANLRKRCEAPRFVLMHNATPQYNVKVNDSYVNGGMVLPHLVGSYESSGSDVTYEGTKYRLVYFGEDGQGTPTYTFPKGTQIVFFVSVNGMNNVDLDPQDNDSIKAQNFVGTFIYSDPAINYAFNKKNGAHHGAEGTESGKESFVTFRWEGDIIIGLEDGYDDDMNDILFYADGDFEEYELIPELNPDTPQTWTIACEDLGTTDDFDFNDVVFTVSHAAGSDKATITPLAAGGILPVRIMYNGKSTAQQNDPEISTEINGGNGEIHHLLGSDATDVMINTTTKGTAGAPIEITVPTDYTISDYDRMGGFSLVVRRDNGEQWSIKPPKAGEAPQMICIPGEWKWPIERTNIIEAYPDFGAWGANYESNATWYKNRNEGHVVK